MATPAEDLIRRHRYTVEECLRMGEAGILRADFYEAAHPGPADVILLVEVADTTQRYDRQVKLPLYARHGVPEAWLTA